MNANNANVKACKASLSPACIHCGLLYCDIFECHFNLTSLLYYFAFVFSFKVFRLAHTIEFFSKECEEDSEVNGAFTLSQHGIQFLITYIQFSLERKRGGVRYMVKVLIFFTVKKAED